MSEMQIMDPTGHTTIGWNRGNNDEIALARAAFTEAIDRGYRAFRVKGDGVQGERITRFDPDAEKMILAPHLVGG